MSEPIRIKTILVGDSGVGKTTIIGCYLDKFNPKEKATIGASFTNKYEKIGENEILFEIWDTAGQERFRSVNSIFYQDAYICIMVYDITKKKSFESLKEYWYNAVKENATDGIIFHVAGNKIDLFEDEEVDRNEVKDYCDTIDAEFNFISAMEKSYIDDLFKKLGTKFINSNFYKSLKESKSSSMKEKVKLANAQNDKEGDVKKKKKCC